MSAPIPWRSHYRALLREISYLPDPVATRYMAQYVSSRFRKFTAPEQQQLMTSSKVERLENRIKQSLRLLKLANEGYLKSLERVILMSYGRIGRRKRLLLNPLLYNTRAARNKVEPFSDQWRAPPLLTALLQSQAEHRQIGSYRVRRPIKPADLAPKVPEFNVFNRPLAEVRKVNIRREWYANVLEKTFPPLPHSDWETLQNLVDGNEPWCPPTRRKGPRQPPSKAAENDPPGGYLSAEFLIRGAKKGPTFRKYTRGRPHQITRRLMRHIWERICALTPLPRWDEEENKWHITWGVRGTPPPLYRQLDPTKGLALFEGVHPTTGKIPTATKRTQPLK